MSPIRSRISGMLATAALLTAAVALPGPALAADSPVEAVDGFFDVAVSRDFERIDEVACAEDREALLEAFDFTAQLGLGESALADDLTVEIKDRQFEVISQDEDTATVAVSATMAMRLPEEQVEPIVRAMLEAEQRPDDPPITDEEVTEMAGFMGPALNSDIAIDEETIVVLEDGEWLVCGGLIDEPEESEFAVEPTISTDGLCGLASPAEVSAAGTLVYDQSNGFETFCYYSTTDWESFHSINLALELDSDAETMAGWFEAEPIGDIAGYAAWATGPEAFQHTLFVQAGPDSLQLTLSLPQDGTLDIDWLPEATGVAEFLLPLITENRVALAGPTPAPTPVPTPEISLCEALPVGTLNELTGMGIDGADGDANYCTFIQADGEPAWHNVQLSLAELSLEDYGGLLPDGQEATIGGLPALVFDYQTIIGLPGDAWTLTVSGFIDEADESIEISNQEMMVLVAEAALPGITVPEPTDFGFEPEPEESLLPRSLCDYLDLDTVNALGVVEYSDLSGFGDFCTLSQLDFDQGFHSMTMYAETSTIDDVRTWLLEPEELTIEGYPALLDRGVLYVALPGAMITLNAALPEDVAQAGVEPSELLVPVAEMVAAGVTADTAE